MQWEFRRARISAIMTHDSIFQVGRSHCELLETNRKTQTYVLVPKCKAFKRFGNPCIDDLIRQ